MPLRRDEGRGTPHPSASLAPVSLRVGRSAGLTRHRRVIQRREALKGGTAVGAKTPAVAEASGRVSLRAGERTRSPFDRQRGRKVMPARRCGKSQPTVAREGFLDRRSKRCFWLLLSPQTKVARAGARNYPCRRQRKRSRRGAKLSPAETNNARLRRCGGELAFPWRGGGLRRPHFFLRRKKCGKESRLDLRSKGPLARCGSCRFGGMHSRMKCSG